ncbi:MAG TPA: hypothetical protein VFT31_08765 [Kribbella sp.]|nr:hypothetical protein [Kribbella sp.]
MGGALGGPELFNDHADRLDVYGRLRSNRRARPAALAETLTAVGVWIVVPPVAGLWASSRREVK